MRVSLVSWLILVGVMLSWVSSRRASAATPDEVEQAIKKAKEYLYSLQNQDGTWAFPENNEFHAVNKTGYTALPVYALLAAGEDPQKPALQKALQYLLTADCEGTYSTGIRLNVWALIPQTEANRKDLRAAIVRDAAALINSGKNNTNFPGKYSYTHLATPREGGGDNSNSQYGILGVWAAAQAELELNADVWTMFDKAWRGDQNPDGGWTYGLTPGENGQRGASTPSMTAAGVASLFIVMDELYGDLGKDCNGNVHNETTVAIDKGLKWMSDNFNRVSGNYTWYGIERIGVASGLKYFGKVDWYQQGASLLLKEQEANGGWKGSYGAQIDTAFALLFLVRGRAPVVINKLQYSIDTHGDTPKEGNWNERPRDVANLVRWMGKQLERDLNWQIVNLDVEDSDLSNAPILYISGNQSLEFSDAGVAKLRRYVERGGLIVANADCKSASFAQGIEKLGSRLFPNYEFRTLPRDHVLYTNEQYNRKNWKRAPDNLIKGLSNGARELMLVFPNEDPGRYWQTRTVGGHEHLHQMMANILLYAVGKKDLRYKGDTYLVTPDPAIKSDDTIKVARIEYKGWWDPEPAGWTRLGAMLHNAKVADVEVTAVKPGEGKLKDFKIAHLTGTETFTLNEAARAEIRQFLDNGGTLIVDAAGGSVIFADAAEKEVSQILPGVTGQLLKTSYPLYKSDGEEFAGISYRNYAKRVMGNSRSPRLLGYERNGRMAVLFSREDLSVGLMGEPVDGIVGYDPASSALLMKKMLLYAMNGAVPAAVPADVPAAQAEAPATRPAEGEAAPVPPGPASGPATRQRW